MTVTREMQPLHTPCLCPSLLTLILSALQADWNSNDRSFEDKGNFFSIKETTNFCENVWDCFPSRSEVLFTALPTCGSLCLGGFYQWVLLCLYRTYSKLSLGSRLQRSASEAKLGVQLRSPPAS